MPSRVCILFLFQPFYTEIQLKCTQQNIYVWKRTQQHQDLDSKRKRCEYNTIRQWWIRTHIFTIHTNPVKRKELMNMINAIEILQGWNKYERFFEYTWIHHRWKQNECFVRILFIGTESISFFLLFQDFFPFCGIFEFFLFNRSFFSMFSFMECSLREAKAFEKSKQNSKTLKIDKYGEKNDENWTEKQFWRQNQLK